MAAVSVGPVTRFVLQPRWLAWHLLLVVVLVSFGWLGRWQLGAFEHKRDAGSAPRTTVALDRLSSPGGRLAADDVGRRVRTDGRYEQGRTVLVPGRTAAGEVGSGFLVVAFLRTAKGVLPVVRGWVPSASAPAVQVPSDPVRVTGLLQHSEDGPPPGTAPVVSDVTAGQLPYVATVTVLDATRYRPGELYDGYLALRAESPATRPAPVAAQAREQGGGVGRWRNLAYALQWWLFAGAAVFFWWAVLRRAVQEQQERERAPGAAAPAPSLDVPRRTTSEGPSLRP